MRHFFSMMVLSLFLAQPAWAQRLDLTRPPSVVGPNALAQDEERLARRERMRAMREALREQYRSERQDSSPRAPMQAPGPDLRGERLRPLPPDERQRLRRQMQEAARELYRR
jgi:hypothetical protein